MHCNIILLCTPHTHSCYPSIHSTRLLLAHSDTLSHPTYPLEQVPTCNQHHAFIEDYCSLYGEDRSLNAHESLSLGCALDKTKRNRHVHTMRHPDRPCSSFPYQSNRSETLIALHLEICKSKKLHTGRHDLCLPIIDRFMNVSLSHIPYVILHVHVTKTHVSRQTYALPLHSHLQHTSVTIDSH